MRLHWLPRRTWALLTLAGLTMLLTGAGWAYFGNLSRFQNDWSNERAIRVGAVHDFCKGAMFIGVPVSLVMFAFGIGKHLRFARGRGGAQGQGASSARPLGPRWPLAAIGAPLVVLLVLAWFLFDLAPERRCRKAMQPFIDASGEVLIAYDLLRDLNRDNEAEELLPAYRLVRMQGFLAAATEWIGSKGRIRMTQWDLDDPLWQLSQEGRQTIVQRLRATGSKRDGLLADSLSRVHQRSFNSSLEVNRTAAELAGFQGDFGDRLTVMPMSVIVLQQVVRVELEANASYLHGESSNTFGIHRWIDPRRQQITAAQWDAANSMMAKHLSPSTRAAVLAAQDRYNLRSELVR